MIVRKFALAALLFYSNDGEILSGQQVLTLAQNDGWRKFDQLAPVSIFGLSIAERKFLRMISGFMRRLKVSPSPWSRFQYTRLFADLPPSLPVQDELQEPGLADDLKPYYHKWAMIERSEERSTHSLSSGESEKGEAGESEGSDSSDSAT
jgi:hypothetical protein